MEKQYETIKDWEENTCPESMEQDRRRNHRRTNESEGYAYIEMVGWMDRREKIRRNNDPNCF